jgi:hypothetical protein
MSLALATTVLRTQLHILVATPLRRLETMRDYAPPTEYRRPVTPPSARYADYPARSGTEARARSVVLQQFHSTATLKRKQMPLPPQLYVPTMAARSHPSSLPIKSGCGGVVFSAHTRYAPYPSLHPCI